LFRQVEDCPVIVVEEDLCGVHCAREPSRVQEQSPSLLVLLLLGGKWHCIFLIELSGVCCEVGQGSVECHWPVTFIPDLRMDGLNVGISSFLGMEYLPSLSF
jgi:hypothetical protein